MKQVRRKAITRSSMLAKRFLATDGNAPLSRPTGSLRSAVIRYLRVHGRATSEQLAVLGIKKAYASLLVARGIIVRVDDASYGLIPSQRRGERPDDVFWSE